MNEYKNLYKWMIGSMVIMQLGIYMDYWGDFTDNPWSVHMHYWIGTVWYFYLIIQPYYATHGQLKRHRTNGIIGMFIAGGVCITSLSMLHRDIANAHEALIKPEVFGPFQPWFFYGVLVLEIIMMLAFGFAVIMSIIRRKNIGDHAWWLISTVFIIMMPAVGRGIVGAYIGINSESWPDIDILIPIYYTQALIIGMLLLVSWRFSKLKHPATYLAVAVNLLVLFLGPIGKMESVQMFLVAVLKG